MSTINDVTKLNEKGLLAEIGYLRLTTYPNIRQKRQVRYADGKTRMEKLSISELQTNIRNSIKPDAQIEVCLEDLLANM